jgi:hypothetical protein
MMSIACLPELFEHYPLEQLDGAMYGARRCNGCKRALMPNVADVMVMERRIYQLKYQA